MGAQHVRAGRQPRQPVGVFRRARHPLGDVSEPAPAQQFVQPGHVAGVDGVAKCFVRALDGQLRALALFHHPASRRRSRTQREVAQQVAAETVDGADARRVHLGGEFAALARTQRGSQLALEIGRCLVGEGDGRNLIERERRGHGSQRHAVDDHGNAEVMAECLHHGRRLSRTGAGVYQQMVALVGDDRHLGIGEPSHRPTSTGPPGMRQTSRAGQ